MALFTLDSGVEMHLAAPDTFYLPPVRDRENLVPGNIVKLVFRIQHGDEIDIERMWVIVESKTDIGYVGMLDNDPYCTSEIKAGQVVRFGPEHVIQIHEH